MRASVLTVFFLPLSVYASAVNVNLASADPFAVLAGSTATNTGDTIIHGNLGLWPGTAITGFPPGIVDGTIEAANSIAMLAESDLTTAYNFAAGEACGTTLTGQDLGGLTLTPGVYCFGSSAQLTGILTLDALGDPNAVFIFQMGSTLTTASNSSVVFANGGQGDSLFWQVGSSATLGTNTQFAGNILALASITLTTGANIPCGRALAINGAVTMDTNHISIDTVGCESGVVGTAPEPGSASLLGVAFLMVLSICGRKAWKKAVLRPVQLG